MKQPETRLGKKPKHQTQIWLVPKSTLSILMFLPRFFLSDWDRLVQRRHPKLEQIKQVNQWLVKT